MSKKLVSNKMLRGVAVVVGIGALAGGGLLVGSLLTARSYDGELAKVRAFEAYVNLRSYVEIKRRLEDGCAETALDLSYRYIDRQRGRIKEDVKISRKSLEEIGVSDMELRELIETYEMEPGQRWRIRKC